MSQLFHIFWKDVRRLRYEITVLLLLSAAFAWTTGHDDWRSSEFPLFAFLLPIGWCYVSALLLYGEGLAGDCQFWLTRPYRRWSLMGAKLLFIASFVFVPVVVEDVLIIGWQGFSPWAHFGDIVVHALELTSAWCLPVAALATVTSGLAQLLMGLLLLSGGVAVVATLGVVPDGVWSRVIPRMEWIRVFTWLLAAATGSTVVLGFQYRWRRTAVARLMLSAVAVLSFLAWMPLPGTWNFAIQQWAGPKERTLPDFTLDLEREGYVYRGPRNGVRALTIRTTPKYPNPLGMLVDRAVGTLTTRDGRRYKLSGRGYASLDFLMPETALQLPTQGAVQLRAFVSFFAPDPAGAALPTGPGGEFVAPDFRCRLNTLRVDFNELTCRAPFQMPGGLDGAPPSYATFAMTISPIPIAVARSRPPRGVYYDSTGALVRLQPERLVPTRVLGHRVYEINADSVTLTEDRFRKLP